MVRPRARAAASGSNNETPEDPMARFYEAMTQNTEALRNNTRMAQDLPAPPTQDRVVRDFTALHHDKFKGEPDAIRAEAWIENLESLFAVLRYDEALRVDLAVFQMEDAARYWWGTVQARWDRTGVVKTWAAFRHEFMEKYVPRIEQDRRIDEFYRLEQGNRNVAQYDAEFNRLLRYVPHMHDNEREKARHFFNGLRTDLQQGLYAVELNTYSHIVERASTVESRIRNVQRINQRQASRPHPYAKPNTGKGQASGSSSQAPQQNWKAPPAPARSAPLQPVPIRTVPPSEI